MADMRKILTSLMQKSGDTPSTLSRKSGVPQPTIHRFLNGTTGDPRSSVVKKLAVVYGLTESQLRGDEPMPGSGKARQLPVEQDEFRRQLIVFYGGMSQKHKDLLVMIANQLYSIDNPKDKHAMPFPSVPELRESVYIEGVTPDRRKS
jgi:transcriptional regulator with XRE-family HTH domain